MLYNMKNNCYIKKKYKQNEKINFILIYYFINRIRKIK